MPLLLKVHRQLMKTPLRRLVDRNLAHPKGLWGRYVAAVMNRVNIGITEFALKELGIQPGEQVLEVAFGGGVSFGLVMQKIGTGTLHGLDMSPDMLRSAEKSHASLVASGRLDLKLGDVGKMPFADGQMDGAFAVNAIYFWKDPLLALGELKRVLKPGGRLVLGLRSLAFSEANRYPKDIFRFYEEPELRSLMESAGFREIRISKTLLGKVETLAVSGTKGA
jgi:arsenite methyltransferase